MSFLTQRPDFQALTLSSTTATEGVSFTANVTNRTANTDLALVAFSNGDFTLTNGVLTGNNLTPGVAKIVLREYKFSSALGYRRETTINLTIAEATKAPAILDRPLPNGLTVVGQTLTATTGDWKAFPAITGYTYQWVRNGVDISGATSATYTLVDGDEGTNVRCRVTATNSVGSTSVISRGTPYVGKRRVIAPLSISGVASTGTVGSGNTFTPTISGGVAPYTLSVSAGTLPAGRSIFGLTVTGNYTTAGSFSYTLRVTDSVGATANLPINVTVVGGTSGTIDYPRIGLVGPSTIAHTNYATNASSIMRGGNNAAGPINWLNMLTPYRVQMINGFDTSNSRLHSGDNAAVGGLAYDSWPAQIAYLKDRFASLPASKRWINYELGRNAYDTNTTAEHIAALDRDVAAMRAAGFSKILLNKVWFRGAGSTGWGKGSAYRQRAVDINTRIDQIAAGASDIIVIDLPAYMHDASTGTGLNVEPYTDAIREDDVHLSSRGGLRCGRAYAAALSSVLKAQTYPASPSGNKVPAFTGTGGQLGPATGTVYNGWNIVANGSAVTTVASQVVADGKPWQRLSFSGMSGIVSNGASVELRSDALTAVDGEMVSFRCRVKIPATANTYMLYAALEGGDNTLGARSVAIAPARTDLSTNEVLTLPGTTFGKGSVFNGTGLNEDRDFWLEGTFPVRTVAANALTVVVRFLMRSSTVDFTVDIGEVQTFTAPDPTGSGGVPLSITGAANNAVVGSSSAFTPTIAGGTGPYTLSLASGTLPPGRAISGLSVGGTYSTAGTYSYTLKVTDASGATATLPVTVTITAAVSTIPWVPTMIDTLELYEAAAPASILNAAGTQAVAGEGVATWNNQIANSRTASQATAAAMPIMGSAADASPTGVVPLTFRGSQVIATAVNSSTTDRYTIFAIMRLKSGITGSKYLIGNDDGGTYNLLQSSSALAGSLRPLIASQTFEVDTTERIRSFTQNMQVAGVSFSRIQGREEGLNTTGSGSSLASGKRFFLGSNSSNNAGSLSDFFAFAFVPSNVSRANQQRMEGYLAHRAGLASSALDPTHPYYSAPPTVPTGTTTTLDWLEFPSATAAQQTFMGGYIELQPDSFYDADISPATDGTTETWGFPQSLIPSERARLKNALFAAGNPMFRYLRLPLGFAYRGLRNIDATSGLAKNIGERYAGINAAIADMMANAVALGGGLMPEYWSPAPHWKTTSRFGKGSLWAGGTYARDVTLASIRTTDVTQFNAQIDSITSAMIDDLEYLHQNVAPVRGFGLQNEAIQTHVDREYGTCRYDASEYGAVLRSIIPKIRSSAILSTYNGQPNTVLLNGESMEGFSNAGVTFSNSTVLSTGKTTLQEMWAQTYHEISVIAPNPDHIRSQSWAWIAAGRGKPTFVNEIEFFEPHLFTDEQRFARGCSWQLHNLNLIGAPVVMPFIHIMKDIDVVGRAGNAKGYALTKMRLPAPYGTDPAANGDPEPTIDYGKFDFVYPNWYAAKFVLDNIPVDAVIRKVDLPTGVSRIAAVGTVVGGKRRMLVCNWDNASKVLNTTLPSNATYNVVKYTATQAPVAIGTVTGPQLTMTFDACTAYVLTEV